MRCLIQTIAFFHLIHCILFFVLRNVFFYPSHSFLYPFRMPSEADSLKWFTLKIRGKEF